MKLVTATSINVSSGDYVYSVIIGTGTSLFEISLDNGAFETIDSSSISASGNGQMTLPSCRFKATLGGDAEAWLNKVRA
jgi:hypothetical protein